MSHEPFDALSEVVDEESFVRFLSVLAADREDQIAKERENPSPAYGSGANGWENDTIHAFLSAAAAWAADSVSGSPMLPPKSTNPWRRCAEILYAGKVYE